MSPAELQRLLEESLEDRLLSRGERQAFRQILQDIAPTAAELAELRSMAFAAARQRATQRESQLVLDWLEEVVKVLQSTQQADAELLPPECHFTPGDDCPLRITQLIQATRQTLDICVFTITDDRIAESIIGAVRRGIAVRIVTDNEKAYDLGSDITRLQDAGVPVKVDQTPFHMHHKFAIFDRQLLLTGSYNWTRGAARDNLENFLVTSDRRHVEPFCQVFDRLWRQL